MDVSMYCGRDISGDICQIKFALLKLLDTRDLQTREHNRTRGLPISIPRVSKQFYCPPKQFGPKIMVNMSTRKNMWRQASIINI